MSIKEKLLIIFLAIVISFVGFNLIASSYAGLLNEANGPCHEAIMNNLAGGEFNSDQIPDHNEKALKFTYFNQYLSNSK